MGPGGLFAHDAKEYASMLGRLFESKAMRTDLGGRGREHALKYYTLEKIIPDICDTYKTVLGSGVLRSAQVTYGYSEMGFLHAGKAAEYPYDHVILGGVPESFDVQIVKRCLGGIRTFWDIGANTGIYCFVAATETDSDARIVAFEPQPECCAQLRETIRLNRWEKKVEVCAIGLGEHPATMDLYLSGTGSTLRNEFNDNHESPRIPVRVDTVDQCRQKLGVEKIDFMKIDVEGFELDVLKGGEKSIESDKPILFIEIADMIKGRSFRNILYPQTLHWLWKRGYVLFRSDGRARISRVRKATGQTDPSMYLCLHPDRHLGLIRAFSRLVVVSHARHVAARTGALLRIDYLIGGFKGALGGAIPFSRTLRRIAKRIARAKG